MKEIAPNDMLPTRRSLLSRLKNWDDNESWTVFFETYWKLIYSSALRAGLTEAEAEDIVQETVFSVCKRIPDFNYDPTKGSFKGWLLQLTSWRITDHLRKQHPQERHAQKQRAESWGTDLVERIPDPAAALEAIWDEEWENNLMEAAIERVKRKVDAKQYQAFDLSVLRAWPVARVAQTLKMNPARIYLAKHRINKILKKEIAALRSKPL